MRITILLLFILPFSVFAQEVETVKISKTETWLFRGQNQEIRDCYVYVDGNGVFFLASLNIQQSEVNAWFEQRKDSQNIYKGFLQDGQYKTLTLTKENEPGLPISFYFERKEKSEIQLVSLEDGRIYIFKLI